MNNHLLVFTSGLSVGIAITFFMPKLINLWYKDSSNTSIHSDCSNLSGDDECNSLFYEGSEVTDPKGNGCYLDMVISSNTLKLLKTVHQDYKKLEFELYKAVVENLIICCCDIMLKRKSDNKVLLFYRRDKPAAGIWWWPGGRMFRGETYFDAAIRKIKDETGKTTARLTPIAMVGHWNTFFPDSNWDKDQKPGKQGTQTVNAVVLVELDDDINSIGDDGFNDTNMNQWAVEKAKWVSADYILQNSTEFDKNLRILFTFVSRLISFYEMLLAG